MSFLQQLIELHDPQNLRVIKRDPNGDTWKYRGGLNSVSRDFYIRHLGMDLMVVKERNVGPEFSHVFDLYAAYQSPSGERMILFQSLPENEARMLLQHGYHDEPDERHAMVSLGQVLFIPH